MPRLLLALALALVVAVGGDVGLAGKKFKTLVRSDQAAQSGDKESSDELLLNDPADPFAFAQARKFKRLDLITVTLELDDGDTGVGEEDEDNLSLELDGIDTGILLNGFDSGQTETLTFSGAPLNSQAILRALKADGALNATIFDRDTSANNDITASGDFDATLVLKGKQKKKKT